jgi:proton-translocating NAD(P)+ transhydrogenase subunit alpha
MAITAEQALEKANAAADVARDAAESAQAFADAAAVAVATSAQAVSGDAGIDPFVFRFAIFVLAIFVGYFVVWSVTSALHTPLMSVTNAISSVIIVGAILAVGVDASAAADAGAAWTAKILGFIALVLASVNIFGGFLVTERMLAMYKKKG